MVGSTRLKSLLQQLEQHVDTTSNSPSSPSGERLGYELASECGLCDHEDRALVFSALCTKGLHGSVSEAFFECLEVRREGTPDWIVALAQIIESEVLQGRSCTQTLNACLRCYARHIASSEENRQLVERTVCFRLWSSMQAVCEYMISHFFGKYDILSAALAVSFYANFSQPIDKLALLCHIRTEASVHLAMSKSESTKDRVEFMAWLTRGLDIFIVTCGGDQGYSTICEAWMCQIVELVHALELDNEGKMIGDFLSCLVGQTLPSMLLSNLEIQWTRCLRVLVTLLSELGRRVSSDTRCGFLEYEVVFRLTSLYVRSSALEQRRLLREIIGHMSHLFVLPSSASHPVTNLVQSVISISKSPTLPARSQGIKTENQKHETPPRITEWHNGLNNSSFRGGATLCSWHQSQTIAAIMSQPLCSNEHIDELLTEYPNLSLHLLPLMLDSICEAYSEGLCGLLSSQIRLLCQAFVLHPVCMQQVWILFSEEWIHKDMRLSVHMIRLLPVVIQSHPRLYLRTVEALSGFVIDENPEVRLAVASTLREMAENNTISDIADVVGWVQSFLLEDLRHSVGVVIVNQALMCLHYLVCADDLEFDLVIKVLNKKLKWLSDGQLILNLPTPIQYALAMLLGDGAESCTPIEISAPMQQSVAALKELGIEFFKRREEDLSKLQLLLLSRVVDCLSCFSLEALGIADVLSNILFDSNECADCSAEEQQLRLVYRDLCFLATAGIQYESCSVAESCVKLCQKLVSYEVGAAGKGLWKACSNRRTCDAQTLLETELSDVAASMRMKHAEKGNESPTGKLHLLPLPPSGTVSNLLATQFQTLDEQTKSRFRHVLAALEHATLPPPYLALVSSLTGSSPLAPHALKFVCAQLQLSHKTKMSAGHPVVQDMISVIQRSDLPPCWVTILPGLVQELPCELVKDILQSSWTATLDSAGDKSSKRFQQYLLAFKAASGRSDLSQKKRSMIQAFLVDQMWTDVLSMTWEFKRMCLPTYVACFSDSIGADESNSLWQLNDELQQDDSFMVCTILDVTMKSTTAAGLKQRSLGLVMEWLSAALPFSPSVIQKEKLREVSFKFARSLKGVKDQLSVFQKLSDIALIADAESLAIIMEFLYVSLAHIVNTDKDLSWGFLFMMKQWSVTTTTEHHANLCATFTRAATRTFPANLVSFGRSHDAISSLETQFRRILTRSKKLLDERSPDLKVLKHCVLRCVCEKDEIYLSTTVDVLAYNTMYLI